MVLKDQVDNSLALEDGAGGVEGMEGCFFSSKFLAGTRTIQLRPPINPKAPKLYGAEYQCL